MRTIGVKLNSEQAEAFEVAARRRGLTISAAIAAILRQATEDFTNFSTLDGTEQPKRGRAIKPRAADEMATCFANGDTVGDLLERFDQPRSRHA